MTTSAKVLCYAPYTIWEPHFSWEITILQALRQRGCEVSYILCDSVYRECDLYQPGRRGGRSRPFWYCTGCRLVASRKLRRTDMPYDWLGKWLGAEDKDNARSWVGSLHDQELSLASVRGWQLGEWVRSSVHIHYRANELQLERAEISETYRRYLYSGYLAATALDRLFDEFRPDVQLLFNGRMSSPRIALEIGKSKGVRTICEERGFVRDRVRLIDGTHCVDYDPITNLWQIWKDVPLSNLEILEIHQQLQNRKFGKELPIRPFSPPKSQQSSQIAERRKPLVVLFTSSLDEVAAHERQSFLFRTQEDWVNEIVRFFRDRPEIELVIRVHPNAGSANSFGTNSGDQAFFRRLEGNVPGNVRVVPSDADVSSYDLMEQADIGLVWHSTTAIEMAALGKRVFRVADAWMKDLECVVKLGEDFSDVLQRDLSPNARHDGLQVAIQARRWAYMWYFRSSYALPLVRQTDWNQAKLLYENPNELCHGASTELDEIVSIFVDGRPVGQQPTVSDTQRSQSFEETATARLLGMAEDVGARQQTVAG